MRKLLEKPRYYKIPSHLDNIPKYYKIDNSLLHCTTLCRYCYCTEREEWIHYANYVVAYLASLEHAIREMLLPATKNINKDKVQELTYEEFLIDIIK